MKLSSAIPNIIDVRQHCHRGSACLFMMGKASVRFNVLIPEPHRLQMYCNELLMFIPPSLPRWKNVPRFSKALSPLFVCSCAWDYFPFTRLEIILFKIVLMFVFVVSNELDIFHPQCCLWGKKCKFIHACLICQIVSSAMHSYMCVLAAGCNTSDLIEISKHFKLTSNQMIV